MSEVCVCPELPQGALVASEETGRADGQHPVPWAKLKTAQSSRQNDTCTHTKTYECSNSYAIQYVFHYWAPRSELSLVVYTDPQNAVKAFSHEKNALLGGGEERRREKEHVGGLFLMCCFRRRGCVTILMRFILCSLIRVCLHLVIELSQQLFQGEADIIVIFLITVGNGRGHDARANQANMHRQLLQNVDHLFVCLSNERDPIHLPRGHIIYLYSACSKIDNSIVSGWVMLLAFKKYFTPDFIIRKCLSVALFLWPPWKSF